MHITDTVAAASCLGRIGYYRLSGYWYSDRKSHILLDEKSGNFIPHPDTGFSQVIVEDDFKDGTTFQQVMDLYVFDKKLRLLLLDAIERIEVAMRVDIALLIGNRSPLVHRDPNELHGQFSKKIDPATGQTGHTKWLARLDESFDRSKDEFVKHFKRKYAGQKLPIWIAVELWDFGMMSVFLSGMKIADEDRLAAKYNLPRKGLLTSIRNLNNVRNMCAHHSRLWNRSPADQISCPKQGEVPLLDHLADDKIAQSRIYATVAVIQYFLRTIHPTSTWGERLKMHIATFPTSKVNNIAQAGFPSRWEDLPLWK